MKKNIKVYENGQYIEKQINYIPLRYVLAILITFLEVCSIIGVVVALAIFVPYFYIALAVTQVVSVVFVVVSKRTPDYKLTWLFFMTMLPVVGLMLFFIFQNRKIPQKYVKKLECVENSYEYNHSENFYELKKLNTYMASQAKSLCANSGGYLYQNTKLTYYPVGEKLQEAMLFDLKNAKKFIFLEYFIIEQGQFWDSLLNILVQKQSQGVEVKIVYDDIGCMGTLPGNYFKTLRKNYGFDVVLFSKLKGQADGEFNNRSHRKIMVIDGQIGFTGGVNIADEYINQNPRLGHWKDTAIRLEGEAVNGLTKLFLTDFYINSKTQPQDLEKYYIAKKVEDVNNFVVPFGDGPLPLYQNNVAKIAIMHLLNHSQNYVYITSPYLIIDDELMSAIKNTAMRGVDVTIIVPHIPDKKFVFAMTKSYYKELIKFGVKVYEYTPGFIHAKSYIADDKTAIIGTINLDYRSLSHHFENGVWIYNDRCIIDMKNDFEQTLEKSQYMNNVKHKQGVFSRLFNTIIKLFAPLL